jgi:hypothetical protein
MKFVFLFFNKNISLIAIQNLFTLLTSLFFVYVIHKAYVSTGRFKYLSLLASIGIGAFISSSIHLVSDTSVLTESIYVNFFVLFFALFIRAIHLKTRTNWILCAISMAVVILIRPSAMFLMVIAIIILFFLIKNGYKKIMGVLFIVSFVGILFLMCVYNYFTIGSFSVSTFTEHALISFTSSFLEKDQRYPSEVNEAIETCQNRVTPAQKNIIENSWDHKKLFRVLVKHYNRTRRMIFNALGAFEKEDSYNLYMKWRPFLREIAVDAIKNRPIVYFKFVYSNALMYFFYRRGDVDFYEKLKKTYLRALNYRRNAKRFSLSKDEMGSEESGIRIYYSKEYIASLSDNFPGSFVKEYCDPTYFSKIKMKKISKKEVRIEPTFLQSVHQGFQSIHVFLFRSNFWVCWFLFTLIFSFTRLLRSHFSNKDAFILFIMTFSTLLHGILVSMSALGRMRLAYPMSFVYYLSLFLFPILLDVDSHCWSKIKETINFRFAHLKKKNKEVEESNGKKKGNNRSI